MATYILSYVLHTDIKQGGHGVYSNASSKTVRIIASDDKKAKRKASELWQQILYDNKLPDSAVIFVSLTRKVNWSPSQKKVQFNSKMQLVA